LTGEIEEDKIKLLKRAAMEFAGTVPIVRRD
jgi:hypothetical protein